MSEPLTEEELRDLLRFSPSSRRYELIGRCVEELVNARMMIARAHYYILNSYETDGKASFELKLYAYLEKIDPNGVLGP